MVVFSGVLGFFTGIGIGLAFLILILFLKLWLRARVNGVPVSMMQIIGMRLRGNPPKFLVDAYVRMIQSGEKISITEVELAFMANKNKSMDINTLVQLVREHERNKE